MNRETKQTITMCIASLLFAVIIVGFIAATHKKVDPLGGAAPPAVVPAWANKEAPFIDLAKCFQGTEGDDNSYNVVIGKNIENIPVMEKCVIAIGDNVRIPPHTDYYFNIGNHICGDLRTGQRLRCPRATDKVQNKTVGIGSEPHGSHEVFMGNGEDIEKNPNADVNFPLFGFVKP